MVERLSWLQSLREWLRLLPFMGRPCLIVRRYGGLGDLLSLLPGLQALKERHPAHALILVTSPGLVKIAALAGVAALVLPSTVRGSGWLAAVLKPAVDLTPKLADEQQPPQPRARRLLIQEFATQLGVERASPQIVRLRPSATSVAFVRKALEDARLPLDQLVVIHTGPSWPVKHWPHDHWCVLAEALKAQGFGVVQIGARGHDGNPETQMCHVEYTVDWRDRLDLPDLAALLSMAKLFIGIDSGPLHLAQTVGTPLVGLFGPTDPSSILPPDSKVNALVADLPCQGCHHHPAGPQHWRTGCAHQIACMINLHPAQVLAACMTYLHG
jgi:ADP-heptose:LPS heptosyltransferase